MTTALEALPLRWGDAWFAQNYGEAVKRVERRTDRGHDPYWVTDSGLVSTPRGNVLHRRAFVDDPAEARARAFELLVLADLLESEQTP